jgi:hypothetical protein
MKKHSFIAFIVVVLFGVASCNKKTSENETGTLGIAIEHTVNGETAVYDQLIYSNEAGNQYELSEVQWFITSLALIRDDGTSVAIMGEDEAWYIDSDIPESMLHNFEQIPSSAFTALQFNFGFTKEVNLSHRFVNPPESFMFWPQYLGGGYHYMKLNGKWLNENGLKEPFNFHLGIGQVYDSTASKSEYVDLASCCSKNHCEGYTPPAKILPVKEFIHNDFQVVFDDLDLIVKEGEACSLKLEMSIENWFKSPHLYDHNIWGGSIMQQQKAMKLGAENGRDVFKIHKEN